MRSPCRSVRWFLVQIPSSFLFVFLFFIITFCHQVDSFPTGAGAGRAVFRFGRRGLARRPGGPPSRGGAGPRRALYGAPGRPRPAAPLHGHPRPGLGEGGVPRAAPGRAALPRRVRPGPNRTMSSSSPSSSSSPWSSCRAGARVGWSPSTPLNSMLQQLCDPAQQLDTARVCGAFSQSELAKALEDHPVSEVRPNPGRSAVLGRQYQRASARVSCGLA